MSKTPKSHIQLVQSLIEEVLSEVGPLGYLSKTNRPTGQQSWDPTAQDKWVESQPGEGDPTQFKGKSTPAGVPKNVVSTSVEDPNTTFPKTANPTIGSNTHLTPLQDTQVEPPSIANITQMLQTADQDQLQRIMAVLKKN